MSHVVGVGMTKTGGGPPGISSEALTGKQLRQQQRPSLDNQARATLSPGGLHTHTKLLKSTSTHSAVGFQSVVSKWKSVTTTTLHPRLGLSQERLNRRWGTDDAVDAFILWPHPGNPVPLDGINLLISSSRVLRGWLTYQISGSIRQQVMKLTSRKWCN